MIKVLMYVGIGTVAMLFPMMFVTWKYGIKLWKSIPIALYAALAGTISTYLWFVVENQRFGGISFFGAVFLVPLAFFCTTKLFRESFGDLMDIFAPGICMMLAVMKVQCVLAGCCGGRAIFETVNAEIIKFPSQIAELINALVLCAVIMILAYRPKLRGTLYPWYMVLYGITRFILNFFRDEWGYGTIPYGTMWSAVAIALGTTWLILSKKKHSGERVKEIYE